MRWKLFLSSLLVSFTTWAVSLTELLDITQHEITRYESQGLANEYPYQYTKLTEYYRYGKLFSSYLLIKPAERMLNLALYSVNPIGVYPKNYFLDYLELNYYRRMKEEQPITLAKVETAFNAYMDWILNASPEVKEYKTLEYLIKDRFLQNWKDFLSAAPKPIYFLVPKNLSRFKDRHFLWLLRISYYHGWIKKIVVGSDNGTIERIKETGILPPDVEYIEFKHPTYFQCLIY